MQACPAGARPQYVGHKGVGSHHGLRQSGPSATHPPLAATSCAGQSTAQSCQGPCLVHRVTEGCRGAWAAAQLGLAHLRKGEHLNSCLARQVAYVRMNQLRLHRRASYVAKAVSFSAEYVPQVETKLSRRTR